MTTASYPARGRPARDYPSGLRAALIVTRRDIRDAATDWRIVTPMCILAFLFPIVVVVATVFGVPFLERADPAEAMAKVVPFGLMICGFFPISFSLVIALETFVGEKERNTLEALLAMPLTDVELFLGKLLAVLIPPFVLSLTATGVFVTGITLTLHRAFDPVFLTTVVLLSLTEAVVMVAGAVVVSSHTTSVRAANLLASFIILPMAVIVQVQSLVVLTGLADALWMFLAVLAVVGVMLVRMGVRAFNREEILAHEGLELSPRLAAQALSRAFQRTPAEARRGLLPGSRLTLRRLYQVDIPQALRDIAPAVGVVLSLSVLMGVAGYVLAQIWPVRFQLRELSSLADREDFLRQIQALGGFSIFVHNLRSLTLGAFVSIFTFGAASSLFLLLTMGIAGFLLGQAALAGYSPLVFFGAFIAPHGVLEISAAVLSAAAAFRFGLALLAPPPGQTFGASLLGAIVNWVKLLGLIVPLLLVAGFLEAHLTPEVARLVFGGR